MGSIWVRSGKDNFGIVGNTRGGDGGGGGVNGGDGSFTVRFGVGGRTLGKERGVVGGRSVVPERGNVVERGVVGKDDRGVVGNEDRGVVGERSPIGKEGRLAAGDNRSFGGSRVKAGNGFNVGGAPSGVNGFALYIRIDNIYFLILFTVKLCCFINRLVLFFVRSHTLFLK